MIRKLLELLQTVKPEESINFNMDLTTLNAYFDACCRRLLEDAAEGGKHAGVSEEEIFKTLFNVTRDLLMLKMLMCDKGNFERCALENEHMNNENIFDFESEV